MMKRARFNLQDVVDDHGNFRQHIADRLEQIVREEDAHARFEPERGTDPGGQVGYSDIRPNKVGFAKRVLSWFLL